MTTQEWLEQVLYDVKRFANPEYQEKVWLKGSDPKFADSWEEAYSSLFDSLIFDDLISLYKKEQYCTKKQISLLKRFRDTLRKYSKRRPSYTDPKILLEDPEWHKIQLLAQDVLKFFKKDIKILPRK